jgi:hypothetical protein
MRGYSQSIALLVIISRISNDLRYKNVFLLRSKEKNVVNLLTPTHYIETIYRLPTEVASTTQLEARYLFTLKFAHCWRPYCDCEMLSINRITVMSKFYFFKYGVVNKYKLRKTWNIFSVNDVVGDNFTNFKRFTM